MPLGLLDLSIVTDQLISMLQNSIASSLLWSEEPSPPFGTPPNVNPGKKFDINVTGEPPDAIRKLAGCQLSLYLFHVAMDRFQRNSPVIASRVPATPPQPVRIPTIPFQPLSLDLYYLLTAYSENAYVQEQQVMSIALKCFHENPIVRATVPVDGRKEEFCLTMEVESADDLGRLWQAIATSIRLSAVYKVSVIFLEPEPPPPPAPNVQTMSLAVQPTSLPYADGGQLIGTNVKVTYIGPNDVSTGKRDIQSYDLFPAVAAPGQSFLLYGAGLNQASSNRVYLLSLQAPEHDVTDWVVPVPNPKPPPPLLAPDSKLTLRLPATVGVSPANTPMPGVYQLRVGNDQPAGTPTAIRSNATPFSIAARVDTTADPPIFPAAGGTIPGAGFVAGNTEVLLDTIALAPTAGAAGAGQFSVNAAETAINFVPPNNLPSGRYSIRVRVNQVESAPAWWINI